MPHKTMPRVPAITVSGRFKPGLQIEVELESLQAATCYTQDGHPFPVQNYRIWFPEANGTSRPYPAEDQHPNCQPGRDFTFL